MTRSRDPLVAYLSTFVVLGIVLGMLGPALPSLRRQVHASVGAISFVFVAQSAGYLAGAVIGGRGFDRGLGHRLLGGALAWMAVGLLLVTRAGSIVTLCAAFAFLGLALGVIEVGSNTLLLWARHPAPASTINALHFLFGVGALLSPLLVNRALALRGTVRLAYLGAACVAVLAAAIVAAYPSPRAVDVEEHARGEHAPPRLVLAVAVFFGLYVGIEVGFSGWIATYAQAVHLGGSASGAAITAVFWAAFTTGRLGGVGLAARVRTSVLLFAGCSLSTVAAVAFAVARGRGIPVWIATIFFALGLAPQFASMLAFANEHLPLTGSATSWFMVASSIGGLLLPWVIGQLLSASGSGALALVIVIASIVTLAWVFVLDRILPATPAAVASPPID
ncbi:MAG TPA: MFS transporter [Acidimicrobiia bacterium]|nr:MFS transporter [Acidimicrobiia bacterium]